MHAKEGIYANEVVNSGLVLQIWNCGCHKVDLQLIFTLHAQRALKVLLLAKASPSAPPEQSRSFLEKSYLSQQEHWQFFFRSFSIFDGVELINFPDGQKYIWNSWALLSLKWKSKKKVLLTSTDLHIWSSWQVNKSWLSTLFLIQFIKEKKIE